MERIWIESLDDGGGMEAARAVFQTEGIALAAVGSLACVQSLWLLAEELGRSRALFCRALTARDYSLGRQDEAIRECVQEALADPAVKGVIVYVSCLEILSCWNPEQLFMDVENPNGIPIEILYRGPLAKRKSSPLKALEQIRAAWGRGEAPAVSVKRETFQREPLEMPDFEKIIRDLQTADCDILLLTPGGCKSCMSIQKEEAFKRVKNTRFQELSILSCNPEMLVSLILQAFPDKKPLVLLGTAVMEAVGFDYEGLCCLLRAHHKEASYRKSNGYAKKIPHNFLQI